MRVAARKFAIALWIGAVVIATYVYFDLSQVSYPIGVAAATTRWYAITIGGAYIIVRSGGLAVLGAIIWILGDIRDRLAPPEES